MCLLCGQIHSLDSLCILSAQQEYSKLLKNKNELLFTLYFQEHSAIGGVHSQVYNTGSNLSGVLLVHNAGINLSTS
jgi:hypothetical protein